MRQPFSSRTLLLAVVAAACLGAGYAIGAQPHMSAALVSLQNARGELAQAKPNKGGHRERALDLVDRAIAQVRQGIAYAN